MYAAFIIDAYSKYMVGWQTATTLRASLAVDTRWKWPSIPADARKGLVHHSDRGIKYLSVRYTTRLAESQIVASVGSRGEIQWVSVQPTRCSVIALMVANHRRNLVLVIDAFALRDDGGPPRIGTGLSEYGALDGPRSKANV